MGVFCNKTISQGKCGLQNLLENVHIAFRNVEKEAGVQTSELLM